MRSFFLILLTGFTFYSKAQPKLILPVGHSGYVQSVDISSDGRHVVTGGSDGIAMIWDRWGHLIFTLTCDKPNTDVEVAFTPNRKLVLTRSTSGAKLWDAETGEGTEIESTFNPSVSGFNAAGDKFFVASGLTDEFKLQWFIFKENQAVFRETLIRGDAEITAAKFHPNDSLIIAAMKDQTINVINIYTGIITNSWQAHTAAINAIDISPDGKYVATASADHTSAMWDIASAEQYLSIPEHEEGIEQVLFAANGSILITSPEYDSVMVWNISSAKPVLMYKVGYGNIDLDPSKQLLLNQGNWNVNVTQVQTGRNIASLDIETHTGPISAITDLNLFSAKFSPDGKYIITASADQSAKIWDVASGEFISSLQNRVPQPVHSVQDKKNNRYISCYRDGTVKMWDITTGRLQQNIKAHDNEVFSIAISETNFATGSRDGTAKVWDITTGKLLSVIGEIGNPWVYEVYLTKDGKRLYIQTDQQLVAWNAMTGKQLFILKHKSSISAFALNSDETQAITASGSDSSVKAWDMKTGKLLRTIRNYSTFHFSPAISHDGTKLAAFSEDKFIKTWDLITGKLLKKIPVQEDKFFSRSLAFSRDDKQLLISTEYDGVFMISVATGERIKILTDDPGIKYTSFQNNYRDIVTVTEEGLVNIYDASTGSQRYTINTSTQGIRSADVLLNGQLLIGFEEGFKVFDLNTNKQLYYSFPLAVSDYLCTSPSGYYQCSPGAANLLHYMKENKVISFQQLDLKYNRPDKVLQSIGSSDTALISSYTRAYHKRISRLGIDSNDLIADMQLPVTEIMDADAVPSTRNNKTLQLRIRAWGNTHPLQSFNLWINDVPSYGIQGISISNKKSMAFDTIVTVTLSTGRNRIVAAVTNETGLESFHQPLFVQYIPEQRETPKTYFIGIGIDKYADQNYNLQWSVKDIRDLAAQFQKKAAGTLIIDTLFNSNVTFSSVQALKQKLLSSSENDKVILAFSGHGVLSKEYDYYLSTHDIDFNDPARKGIAYEAMERLLDNIPARNKLMLIDACHSGEIDKDELEMMGKAADSLKLIKGITIIRNKKTLGLRNSFELMQELFTNVSRSTGSTVISAAAGTQFALERGDLRNGVFTYAILEAMQAYPQMNVNELKRIVSARVEQLTNGMQKPTSRTENRNASWALW